MSDIRVDPEGLKQAKRILLTASSKTNSSAGELVNAKSQSAGALGDAHAETVLDHYIDRLVTHLQLNAEMLGELANKVDAAGGHYRRQDHRSAQRIVQATPLHASDTGGS